MVAAYPGVTRRSAYRADCIEMAAGSVHRRLPPAPLPRRCRARRPVAMPLELCAHEFQMNLAANIIEKEDVHGEQNAIAKNLEVAQKVRKAIKDSGGTLP